MRPAVFDASTTTLHDLDPLPHPTKYGAAIVHGASRTYVVGGCTRSASGAPIATVERRRRMG